jgi:hypothetical protein
LKFDEVTQADFAISISDAIDRMRSLGGQPLPDYIKKTMTAKLVLDCESFEAALESLARIFQTTPGNMKVFLSSKEIGAYYEIHWRELPDFRDYVYAVAETHLGSPLALDVVCWFHTTRVLAGTTFSEGILPLNAALPSLKARLVDAVDDIVVRDHLRNTLEASSVADHHYSNKSQNSMHWGPYAILVREVAFHATKLSQHDYLGMPEIIEDICNGFMKKSGVSLIGVFSAKLKPAIVKFTSTSTINDDESCIATALCYVYSSIHEGAPCANSVTCFDGKNHPVPPQDIQKVDFLEANLVEA